VQKMEEVITRFGVQAENFFQEQSAATEAKRRYYEMGIQRMEVQQRKERDEQEKKRREEESRTRGVRF
jgi:hypothetical protein